MTSPFNPNMAPDLPPIGLRRVVYLKANRPPNTGTSNDDTKYRDGSYYEPDTEWRDESVTPNEIWKLEQIHNKISATWIKLTNGSSGPMLAFLPDLGFTPIVPNALGEVTLTSTGGTVQISGFPGPVSGNHTINFEASIGPFQWIDQGTSITVDVQKGYRSTLAITLTLPMAPADGSTIQFETASNDALQIQAQGSEQIALGSSITSAGGTLESIAIHSALTLVYRSADTTWISQNVQGNWLVA